MTMYSHANSESSAIKLISRYAEPINNNKGFTASALLMITIILPERNPLLFYSQNDYSTPRMILLFCRDDVPLLSFIYESKQ